MYPLRKLVRKPASARHARLRSALVQQYESLYACVLSTKYSLIQFVL
jgi:hypothetical protein